MPTQDKNGATLSVGDRVLVPCSVQAIQEIPGYPELTLTTDTPMYPGEYGTRLLLRGLQVERLDESGLAVYPPLDEPDDLEGDPDEDGDEEDAEHSDAEASDEGAELSEAEDPHTAENAPGSPRKRGRKLPEAVSP